MAEVLIKKGFLTYEGTLYRAGDVVDVAEHAEDIIARSDGRIVLPGQEKKEPAPRKTKTGKPAKENATKSEDGDEEVASLPEADPTAAVKK